MAYCPNCGNPLQDGNQFCPNCGASVYGNFQNDENINMNQYLETGPSHYYDGIRCPQCGSTNTYVQIINETVSSVTKTKAAGHGCLATIFFWWLYALIALAKFIWWCIMWVVFGLFTIVLLILHKSKPKKTISRTAFVNRKVKCCVCNSCGNSWEIR